MTVNVNKFRKKTVPSYKVIAYTTLLKTMAINCVIDFNAMEIFLNECIEKVVKAHSCNMFATSHDIICYNIALLIETSAMRL